MKDRRDLDRATGHLRSDPMNAEAPMTRALRIAVILACCFPRPRSQAVEPTPSEQLDARREFDGWLMGPMPRSEPVAPPATQLLRQDYAALERRRSVLRTPFRIANQRFEHGLGTHATSHVRVYLPSDAERFTAKVGIDNNYDTAARKGSVIFTVRIADKEVFRSKIMRGPDPALSVNVPVGHAPTLDLHVSNAGDGDSHDQCDWADATIITREGRTTWLDEMTMIVPDWIADGPPFSFQLDGKDSSRLLLRCRLTRATKQIDGNRTQHTLTYMDAGTGIQIVCEAVRYADFPAVEWVLRFANTASADSPILENIQPLDLSIRRPGGNGQFLLHAARGGVCSREDYAPLLIELTNGKSASLSAAGGRSSNNHLPFFNVEAGDRGLAVAVGWSGQWRASFAADQTGRLHIRAGMERTHLRLQPGESIRTPRILLVLWEVDRYRGHNMMRPLIYRHHTPLLDGKKPLPPTQCNTWFPVGDDGNLVTERNQIDLLNAYAPLGIEYMVMDAGWFDGKWSAGVGNWTVRRDAFPNGLKPVRDAARRVGIRFGMWFEPERVHAGTRLDREHPDWLIALDGNPDRLLNLGLPEAQRWFVDMVSQYVDEVGLGYFRHDFNMDPLPYWQRADSSDRLGMTEIRYIEGLYNVWDRLHTRYPAMLMEGCASGGRRIDLESLSRCHTYWKSDLYGDLLANQGHVYGASLYVPGNYLNTPLFDLSRDPYALRSQLGGALCLGWNPCAKGFDAAMAAAWIEEFKARRPMVLGDFYPLMPYSVLPKDWTGYQFHRGDARKGMVLMFRHDKSPYAAVDVQLHGLSPCATYDLRFEDAGEVRRALGRDLARALRVAIDNAPGSALITYAEETDQ